MYKEIPCELAGPAMAVLNAMAGRAEYLYFIAKAMDEAGVEDTDEILKKAIYNVGEFWGEKLGACDNPSEFWSKLLTDDIRQILKLDWVRDEGDEVELHFYRCPLVFGWQRMGLDSEMIERLCRIAHQVDFGNVESHGFVLDMEPGLGHGEERCVLKVSKKK